MRPTTIRLSKSKIALLVLVACAVVAFGFSMLTKSSAEIEAQRRFNNPMYVHGVGLVSIGCFGLVGVLGLRKLFDSSPGLIVDDRGITDNTSGFSAGFIPWTDISGIEERKFRNQRILYVLLKDPDKYIESRGPIAKVALRAMKSVSASPVSITSSTLQIGFDELVALIGRHLATHRQGVA